MAIKLTYTNGVVRQFPNETQQVYCAIDEASNRWMSKPVNQVQAGDKVSYEPRPKGPTLEVATTETV